MKSASKKETTDNEESGKFTNFHNWQMIAIESGCTIVVGMVNAIYGAYKEEELVGIYNMMDNIGWLDWE